MPVMSHASRRFKVALGLSLITVMLAVLALLLRPSYRYPELSRVSPRAVGDLRTLLPRKHGLDRRRKAGREASSVTGRSSGGRRSS